MCAAGTSPAYVEQRQPRGVAGILYDPPTLTPVAVLDDAQADTLAYGGPRSDWLSATRHVTALHGVTPVNMADLP